MQVTIPCCCEDSSDHEDLLGMFQETPTIPGVSFETTSLATKACFSQGDLAERTVTVCWHITSFYSYLNA